MLKDFYHSIDFLHRVVKIKAGASCTGHAEPAHQRLIAMMTATHGQTVLVRERGQIMRMRSVHHKSYERAALSGRPENSRAGQFSEALGCVARKLRIVFENR